MLDRSKPVPRYYRVAIEYNLFGEYSVTRDWGRIGQAGAPLHGGLALEWYSNLRDACLEAEKRRGQALRRGYLAEERLAEAVGRAEAGAEVGRAADTAAGAEVVAGRARAAQRRGA